jgi:hypothetical protein
MRPGIEGWEVGLNGSFAAGSPTSVVFAVRPAAFHHAKEQTAVAPVHLILSRAEASNMLTHQYRKSLEKANCLLKHRDSYPRIVSLTLLSSIEKKIQSWLCRAASTQSQDGSQHAMLLDATAPASPIEDLHVFAESTKARKNRWHHFGCSRRWLTEDIATEW